MANLAGAFAFLVLAVTSCLFQTEATRPGQFITITSSPAPAPTTSEISFPPASLSTPASAPGPAIGDISFPSPPVSAPVSAPEIAFPVDSAPAPGPAIADDVSPSPMESDTGYGLYGFQTKENPSTETFRESRTTENSFNYNFNNNGGYSQRHFDKHNGYTVPERQGISDTKFTETDKYYNDVNDNNLDNYNNNNGGYSQGVSDTKYYNDVNNNNGYSEKYNYNKGSNNGGYNMPERQGLSDTRFMDNGKYYYDVNNNENNRENGYEPMKENEGYNGNFQYEFDSMEEYDKHHGYPRTQTWEDQP
ncbi:PREDICTED: homeobox protein 2-like isoform X3 [Ipomoea nil]|uniref:homeobox protein 2-like isoform X3 n=1 Tax=Ipomoea nil TaxID=35883 RepID=UPI000901087B|nr:PREDICTED: homeobox protein 2-like isoform X3 [Ipomoea nil]